MKDGAAKLKAGAKSPVWWWLAKHGSPEVRDAEWQGEEYRAWLKLHSLYRDLEAQARTEGDLFGAQPVDELSGALPEGFWPGGVPIDALEGCGVAVRVVLRPPSGADRIVLTGDDQVVRALLDAGRSDVLSLRELIDLALARLEETVESFEATWEGFWKVRRAL